MYLHFIQEPDLENLLIDITIVRAHPCAAGHLLKRGEDAQSLGRSIGGFSTKVHASVAALDNPQSSS